MDIGVRADPVLAHNFVITLTDSSSSLAMSPLAAASAIADVALAGFSECTGLEMSLDVEEYSEGGNNGTVLKFPTRVRWATLTLKRGVGAGSALWDWHYGFVEGRGRRRDGTVVLLDGMRLPRAIWHFRRGLPVKYSGPALNASQSAVAIESIEIAHEGLYQVPGVAAASGAAAGLVGAVV